MEKIFITFHKRNGINSFLRGHNGDRLIILGCIDKGQADAILNDLREDEDVSYIRVNTCGRTRKGYTHYSANDYLENRMWI